MCRTLPNPPSATGLERLLPTARRSADVGQREQLSAAYTPPDLSKSDWARSSQQFSRTHASRYDARMPIEAALLLWARWSAYRIDGVFPSESPIGRIVRLGPVGAAIRSDFGSRLLPTDQTAEAVERAVIALPADLRRVVVVWYLGRGTLVQRAADLHLSYDSMRRRLVRARSMLSESLGV